MKNRGRTEMLAAMLEVAKGKVTKTKIMYIAFLSYGQLKEYLSILIENNLIEYLDGDNKFKTTEKGIHFLKMHNQIEELLQTTTKNN
ncbi:MAG TPA: winged helix-turn-helix domain-containing protein [Nitrososphaeraceae archaeon]